LWSWRRNHAPAKSKVLVRENEAGELHVESRGQSLAYTQIERRPERKQPPWEAKLQADAYSSSGLLKTSTQGTFLLWYDTL